MLLALMPMPVNYQTLPLVLVVLLLLANQRVIIVATRSPTQAMLTAMA
jgi:hypothetical protein